MNYTFEAVDERGNRYPFTCNQTKHGLSLILKKETFSAAKKLYLFESFSFAEAGTDGYYIVPRNSNNSGDLMVDFRKSADVTHDQGGAIMSFYGIKKEGLCCIVRLERVYCYTFEIKVRNGRYSICAVANFGESGLMTYGQSELGSEREDVPHSDVKAEVVFLSADADYNDMAAAERNIRLERGEIISLAEKCKRECVEYARKYPLVRIRMGWKPSPSPVKHQNAENEPEMHVACTFGQVREFADELKKQGVEGAEIQLVGWNAGGHDGRFPQLFPADERLGGDAELAKTVDYVKKLGYRISVHTNSIDAVEVADCFDWNDICERKEGPYLQIGDYSGGVAYHVCPKRQLEIAKRELPRLSALGLNGLHFIDVTSIRLPDLCYSPKHPCMLPESIDCACKLMEYAGELFGGFSSEGCYDFANKYLDYGLYVAFGDGFGRKKVSVCDRFLPVWELVYHGTVLYNPLSTTINYPIKTKADRLCAIMRGGRPSLYVNSRFRTGAVNWMGEADLTSGSKAELERAAKAVAEALDEYGEEGARRQLLYMTR
ncbi:MAG: DUF5696 domain-containing protein, partial [Candidatus Neoclostridium sp.]